MRVFKYLDYNGGLATLRDCCLKATRPNKFNDPLEFHARIVMDDKRRAFRDTLKADREVDDLALSNLKKAGVLKPAKREIRQEFLSIRRRMRERFDATVQIQMDKHNAQRVDELSRRLAVICFSRNENNNLMWSHYSDEHRGILVEFDASKIDQSGEFVSHLTNVDYLPEPPQISYIEMQQQIERNQLELEYAKAEEWVYEDECRVHVHPSDLIKKQTEEVGELLLLDFKPDAVKRVIFGCRVTGAQQSELGEILKEDRYEHVQAQYAHCYVGKYKLSYKNEDFGA